MKNQILDNIMKYAISELERAYGFCGAAIGDDTAMVNSSDEYGTDVNIVFTVKGRDPTTGDIQNIKGGIMSSKIQSVTIVNQEGTRAYCVGVEYNGLLLNQIHDKSIEFPDSITMIYRGYTKDNELVFEAINAPIDVQYEKA